jgi:hypothetical protein
MTAQCEAPAPARRTSRLRSSRFAAFLLAALATLALPVAALPAAASAASDAAATSSAPNHRIGHEGHGTGRGVTSTSTNWSGYSVTGGTFSSVTATWVQPAVTPASTLTEQEAAFWVGLDGDSSPTVEQIGTDAFTIGGLVEYSAWWEMFPDTMVTIGSMSVRPGDTFTATVTGTAAGSFKLSLRNVTTGQTFSTTRTSTTAQRSSAEVIAEAPASGSGTQFALADFGSVAFSACAADAKPLSAYTWDQITMQTKSGTTLATPGPLSTDGTSFSVAVGSGGGGSTDTSPPLTTVTGGDALWHDVPVTLTFSASDGAAGSGVASTEYSVDGGAFTRGTTVTIPAPQDHSNDGVHDVRYRSADVAGNVEALKTQMVRIDTLGPVASARNANVTRGAFASLRYLVKDTLSPRVTSRLTLTSSAGVVLKDWSWGYRTPPAGNSPWTKRFRCTLPTGTYKITVTGADLAGNTQSVGGSATLRVR